MTGDVDDENLFRALTTSSTILLKTGLFLFSETLFKPTVSFFFLQGEMCKPYRRLEVADTNSEEINNEWTLSFEQLEAAMNAETSIVTWFELNIQHQSLEQRIHNYNQDFLR